MELEKLIYWNLWSFFTNSKGMRSNKLENFFHNKGEINTKYLLVETWLKQKDYSTSISFEIKNDLNNLNKKFL